MWGPQSGRSAELPPDWGARREAVLARDGGRCTWTEHGDRCAYRATDVDHMGAASNHELHNLRALCAEHHRYKTASDAGRNSPTRFRSNKRPRKRHPGLIDKRDRNQLKNK